MAARITAFTLAIALALTLSGTLAAEAFAIPPLTSYVITSPADTAPIIQISGEPHWYNAPVTVTFFDIGWSDPLMEGTYSIQSVYYTLDQGPRIDVVPTSTLTAVEDGAYYVQCQGTWGGYALPIEFGIDRTGPQLSVDATNVYLVAATIHATASDAHTGLSRVEMKLDSGAWRQTTQVSTRMLGEHTVYARAFDLLGNESDASAGFRVRQPQTIATSTTLHRRDALGSATIHLYGAVSPAGAPGAISIARSRLTAGVWRPSGSAKVKLVDGSFEYDFTPPSGGTWRFVASYPGAVVSHTTYVRSTSEVVQASIR